MAQAQLIGLVKTAGGSPDPKRQYRGADRRHGVRDGRGHVGKQNGVLLERPLRRPIDRGSDGLPQYAVADGEAVHTISNGHHRSRHIAPGDDGVFKPGKQGHVLEKEVQRVDGNRFVPHQDLAARQRWQFGRSNRNWLPRFELPGSQIVHRHLKSLCIAWPVPASCPSKDIARRD